MAVPERRLTVILCADVVGYSRLVGVDETGTLARLEQAWDILRRVIQGQGGRVFNLAGDGLLAEFPSALGAVQAAIAGQDQLGIWAADQPDDQRMRLRIGINLGDVVISGDDLLGEGVNVAARLQEFANPGGICMSAAVHDQVRGRIETSFADLGARPMKNIASPIHVYALRIGVNADQLAAALPIATPPTLPAASAPATQGWLPDFLPRRVAGALGILAILLVINLMTSPHRLWVQWPALGFVVALGFSWWRYLWRAPERKPPDRAP